MNNKCKNIFRISAKDLELTDLDFPECAEKLRHHIENQVFFEGVDIIELDLRWCVVIYSQANLFLDSFLSAISHVPKRKLNILTSNNYKTRELTCYELFRTTKAVNTYDHNPKVVSHSVDQYCLTNDLIIEIKVFSGDNEDLNSKEILSFIFPAENL